MNRCSLVNQLLVVLGETEVQIWDGLITEGLHGCRDVFKYGTRLQPGAVVYISRHLFQNTPRPGLASRCAFSFTRTRQLTFRELQLQLRQLLPYLRRQGHTDGRRGLQHHRQ